MKNLLLLFVLTAICSFVTSNLQAQVNPKISVQGTLKDDDRVTVADGDYSITFKLYHQATGGTSIWEETADVTVSGGIYSYNIGTTVALAPALFEEAVFLGINIDGIELSPRGEMTFAPYALAVEYAATAGALVGGEQDLGSLTVDINTTGNVTLGADNLNATAGEESLKIIRGNIQHDFSNPTNPIILAGAGFTITYCETGCPNALPGGWNKTYTITFDTPFSALPTATATSIRSNGPYATISYTAENYIEIVFLSANDSVTSGPASFQFIVVGPR